MLLNVMNRCIHTRTSQSMQHWCMSLMCALCMWKVSNSDALYMFCNSFSKRSHVPSHHVLMFSRHSVWRRFGGVRWSLSPMLWEMNAGRNSSSIATSDSGILQAQYTQYSYHWECVRWFSLSTADYCDKSKQCDQRRPSIVVSFRSWLNRL